MKFKTPCFVRVENYTDIDSLIDWCVALGYMHNRDRSEYDKLIYVGLDQNRVDCEIVDEEVVTALTDAGLVDCGTDVELFKALSAITEAPRHFRNQWVIAEDGNMCFCDFNDPCQLVIRGMLPHNIGLRKATAEEIIEHFKNR